MPKNVSFDLQKSPWEIEREAIARQLAQIEQQRLLRSRDTSTGQMVGDWYVPKSWTQGLAGVVENYLGSKKEKSLEEKAKQSQEEERKSLADDVKAYLELLEDKPGLPEKKLQLDGPLREVPVPAKTGAYYPLDDFQMKPLPPPVGSLQDQEATLQAQVNAEQGTPPTTAPIVAQGGGQVAQGAPTQEYNLDPMQATAEPEAPTLPYSVKPNRPLAMDDLPVLPKFERTMVEHTLPAVPGRPADPKAALALALASKHPLLQKLGMDKVGAMTGGGTEITDWLKLIPYATPGSLVAAGAPPAVGKIVHRPAWNSVDGALYNKNAAGEPVLADTTKGRFTQTVDSRGDKYNVDTVTGEHKKADNAATTNVNVSVDAFEKAWKGKQAELISTQLQESGKMAGGARRDLRILEQAESILAQGAKTGVLVNPRNYLDKLAVTMGIKSDNPKITNTDMLLRTMGERVAAILATGAYGAGTGISERDLLEVKKVAEGLDLTEQGMRTFLRVAKQVNQQILQGHTEILTRLEGIPDTLPGFTKFMQVNPPEPKPYTEPQSREEKLKEIEKLKKELGL